MKKSLAIIFALVLFVSFSVSAFAAEYTVGADGNAVYDTAVGYVFDIEDVNGTINGEDATILTSADGLANCGVWAIWLVAEKVEGTEAYKAITNGAAMGGAAPVVTLEDNQIIVVVHSSSSNPNDADSYPNWEDKVACLAIKTGDYLVFDGIDLAAGTCTNGTMTVVTEDQLGDLPPATESEAPSESSEAPAESSEAPAESSETATETVSDATSTEASAEDSDVKTSEMEIDGEGGLGIWLYVIIGVAAVALIAVIAVLAKKKK